MTKMLDDKALSFSVSFCQKKIFIYMSSLHVNEPIKKRLFWILNFKMNIYMIYNSDILLDIIVVIITTTLIITLCLEISQWCLYIWFSVHSAVVILCSTCQTKIKKIKKSIYSIHGFQQLLITLRISHRSNSIKKLFLEISQYSHESTLCWSFFLVKLHAFRFVTLLERDSNTNFPKHLRTLILKDICERLLLNSTHSRFISHVIDKVYSFSLSMFIFLWNMFRLFLHSPCEIDKNP